MVDISNLNKNQKKAVEQTDGPLIVLAGAGSGKTKTLVTKILYLLEEKKISPFRVLALTFSNKAAREMRERVSSQNDSDLGALQITTFHSFCARVLRSEANYLGLSRNFTVYDTSESKAIVKSLLSRRGISTKELSPYEILYFIDEVKNAGYFTGVKEDHAIDLDDPLFSYYEEYESELHKANAVDFGGLITAVLELFEKFPEVLQRYQERFSYLLIDEYQDTNRAQFTLMRQLASVNKNICVVGDEDQSIYSWRGADIRNILDFEKIYPDAKTIKLEQNYRSSKNIIEAASYVISRNEQRKGKSMWTNNPQGESINVVECQSDKDESQYISEQILSLSDQQVSLNDIAIFYRTNAQSRQIEDGLRKYNLPYRVVGGVKFYERKEIKDLLAYLRIIVNEKDSLALSRIINVPARGIGATTLRKLEQEAISLDSSLWEIIGKVVSDFSQYKHLRLMAKVKSALTHLHELMSETKLMVEANTLPSLIIEKILYESGYWDFIKASKDYESQARQENIEEFINAIKQFEKSNERPSLVSFLESITLDASGDAEELSNRGEISLMTIHGAKGLEFGHVFVAGVEENVFPSFKSMDNGELGIEEERRLFYVAMTRAMEKLHIIFAQGRMLFGQLKFNGPSRFINEIPNKYYNWTQYRTSKQQPSNKFDDFEFSQENEYQQDVVYRVEDNQYHHKFPEGSRIIHTLYGEGTILEANGQGADEKVVIKFMTGEKKRFLVKFAPLALV
jgi:DNA helicase II / ATP-dependent DNA helicase PcrA